MVENTVKQVNNYITLGQINLSNDILDDKSTFIKEEYLDKPVLTNTQSREEIENKKAQEEYERKLAQYNNNRNTYIRNQSTNRYDSSGNNYYYGYCTWYAKSKRPDLPNQLGNGGAWYYNAQRAGLETGDTPNEGAVIVTRESGWGHVGYVESVDGDKVTISEMNFNGWGQVNNRTLSIDDPVIKGFVY